LRKTKILDTTLRDGSYAVNFSFSINDTKILCKNLEEAGIEYIEIGHGSGLNSSNRGYGIAAQTDEEYMVAADEALTNSKYGMFCIPGIARLEDLDLAVEHNMSFVRIGTDVTKVPQSEDFIKRAKDLGLFVSANYMKSYALKPEKFAEKVVFSERYGADMICIVDSAGGMFPEDVRNYYNAVRKISDLPIGFHGHDNLGLGVSNTITAVQLGAMMVDSSLQGLGRSSGNVSTEVLVLVLRKKGFDVEINYKKILDIGQEIIQPLLSTKGKNPLDIIAGYADFHSSHFPKILKCAIEYNVDPIELIIEITNVDKVDVDEKILNEIAKTMKKSKYDIKSKYESFMYIGGEQDERNS